MNSMTVKQIEVIADMFNYDIIIDGDNMKAHVYMDGLYSHSFEVA